MKFIFLTFFVFVASLPVEATYCDMQEPQEVSHNRHGDMQHDKMPEMDCCDQDPSTPPDLCDSNTHCGASATVVAIDVYTTYAFSGTNNHHFLSDINRLPSRFTSPPFRPPIA